MTIMPVMALNIFKERENYRIGKWMEDFMPEEKFSSKNI